VQRLTGTAAAEQRSFSQWLLDLGSGTLEQEPDLGIRIPDNMAMYSGARPRRGDPCAPGMHVTKKRSLTVTGVVDPRRRPPPAQRTSRTC